jgi:hypothetical protein
MQRVGHGLFYCTVTISVCRNHINLSEQKSYRSRVTVCTPHIAHNYRIPLYINCYTGGQTSDAADKLTCGLGLLLLTRPGSRRNLFAGHLTTLVLLTRPGSGRNLFAGHLTTLFLLTRPDSGRNLFDGHLTTLFLLIRSGSRRTLFAGHLTTLFQLQKKMHSCPCPSHEGIRRVGGEGGRGIAPLAHLGTTWQFTPRI